MTTQIGFLDILVAWQQSSSQPKMSFSLKDGIGRTALALFFVRCPRVFQTIGGRCGRPSCSRSTRATPFHQETGGE